MPLCVLHVSTSTPASHLRNSIPLRVLHVPTPAARLHRISGTPYLYASYTSLHPQHACSASPELHIHVYKAPYLHVYISVELPTSTPPPIHVASDLYPPCPHVCRATDL